MGRVNLLKIKVKVVPNSSITQLDKQEVEFVSQKKRLHAGQG